MGIIQNDTYDKILSITLPFYNHNIIPVASNTMGNKMYWINTNEDEVNFRLVIESIWSNKIDFLPISLHRIE